MKILVVGATGFVGKTPKEFIVDEARRLAICDCGKTGNSPMCDGTHSKS